MYGKFNLYKNNKGTILFMSIIILTTILGAALGAANLVLSGIMISGTEQRSTQAYFAADAGIEESLWWARKSSTSTTTLASDIDSVASGILTNGASYDVDYTTWTSGGIVVGLPGRTGGYVRNFESKGEFNNTRRTVEAQYGFVPLARSILECDADHLHLCDNQTDCENAGGTWNGAACLEAGE